MKHGSSSHGNKLYAHGDTQNGTLVAGVSVSRKGPMGGTKVGSAKNRNTCRVNNLGDKYYVEKPHSVG